jgi:hypothetical protein
VSLHDEIFAFLSLSSLMEKLIQGLSRILCLAEIIGLLVFLVLLRVEPGPLHQELLGRSAEAIDSLLEVVEPIGWRTFSVPLPEMASQPFQERDHPWEEFPGDQGDRISLLDSSDKQGILQRLQRLSSAVADADELRNRDVNVGFHTRRVALALAFEEESDDELGLGVAQT